MKTFKSINFKRNYECTSIKYIQTNGNPDVRNWSECDELELELDNVNQIDLIFQDGQDCRRFGYL